MTAWQWSLTVLAALVTGYAVFVAALIVVGRRESARALVGFPPHCIVLFRRLCGDARVSRRHKLLLAFLVAYLSMPLDLIPDFIPVAGQLDDVVVIALVLRAVLRAAGAELIREHWPGPDASLEILLRLGGRAAQASA